MSQSESGKGYFERLGEYGKIISENVSNRFNTYFAANNNTETKPTTPTESRPSHSTNSDTPPVSSYKDKITLPSLKFASPKKEEVVNASDSVSPTSSNPEENQPITDVIETNYWVVKIPIIEDADYYSKNEYDKAEARLQQTLLEEKVDKSLGKSKIGKMYEVGSRYIRICEEIQEWKPYEKEQCDLPGTVMKKMYLYQNPTPTPK
jgi:hypothetical protein